MSADRKVLAFIKENPGVTPREIADALGLPYNAVRAALMRLREAGYLIRSSKGGYVVRAALPSGLEDELRTSSVSLRTSSTAGIEHLINEVEELRNYVSDLRERVERLEKELIIIKKGLQSKPSEAGTKKVMDKLLRALEEKKVIRASEALKLTDKPLEAYVRGGKAVIIGNLIASARFFEGFRRKFPLKVSEVKSLTWVERELLETMVREGIVYLHGGREYRIIEGGL